MRSATRRRAVSPSTGRPTSSTRCSPGRWAWAERQIVVPATPGYVADVAVVAVLNARKAPTDPLESAGTYRTSYDFTPLPASAALQATATLVVEATACVVIAPPMATPEGAVRSDDASTTGAAAGSTVAVDDAEAIAVVDSVAARAVAPAPVAHVSTTATRPTRPCFTRGDLRTTGPPHLAESATIVAALFSRRRAPTPPATLAPPTSRAPRVAN